MNNDKFSDGRRLMVQPSTTQPTTIAQQALESRDAYEFAVMYAAYKGMPSPMIKVFHFEDGSYLSFNVTYTPAEAGRTFPCAPTNWI